MNGSILYTNNISVVNNKLEMLNANKSLKFSVINVIPKPIT